ncbi:TPA: glycosyltransferase [Clostridium perfringens]
MKIQLSDNCCSGHHKIYQNTLKKIENTTINNFLVNFTSDKKKIIKMIIERNKYICNSIKKTKNGDIIHYLYIDPLYKYVFMNRKLTNKNIHFIGTLHWFPKGFISKVLLKKFCEKMEMVVVHSIYIEKKLNDIGINNVKCIDYPSFLECKKEYSYNKKGQEIIISCLGGTRMDKGLDILIDSFKYIDDSIKRDIVFNICGIEQDIKYEDLQKEAKKYNINIIVKNKFLTDNEYAIEILKSDVILLPYRKMFSGNSGPMTDGVFMNKYILGPDKGNLGFLIKNYNLGSTFEQENPIDLAKKLSDLYNKNLVKNHKYKENLSLDRFIESHKKLYKEISERK